MEEEEEFEEGEKKKAEVKKVGEWESGMSRVSGMEEETG